MVMLEALTSGQLNVAATKQMNMNVISDNSLGNL